MEHPEANGVGHQLLATTFPFLQLLACAGNDMTTATALVRLEGYAEAGPIIAHLSAGIEQSQEAVDAGNQVRLESLQRAQVREEGEK